MPLPKPKTAQFLQEVIEPDVQPVEAPEVLTEIIEEAPVEETPKKKKSWRSKK